MRSHFTSCFFIAVILFSQPFLRADPPIESHLEAGKIFPSKPSEIQKEIQTLKERIQDTIARVTKTPHAERNFENTIESWNRAGNELLVKFIVLKYLTAVAPDPQVANAGLSEMQSLQRMIFETFANNANLYEAFIQYIHKAQKEPLTPIQWYTLSSFLEGAQVPESIYSQEKQSELDHLKKLCANKGNTPFVYKKGNAIDKVLNKKDNLTVFNLNTCFLPPSISLLFGGTVSWQKRVGPLSKRILKTDADIVCLQEVFVDKAGTELFEKLKNNYAHFYLLIGQRPFGLSLQTIGLPSGLFVASKFPIENPTFTLFKVRGSQANYGCFDFTVTSQNKPIAHIYNTHLQAFNSEHFPKIRFEEFNQILNLMQSHIAKEGGDIPYLLCGDLNIPWGSNELGEKLIKTHFMDTYNHKRTKISEKDYTCTEYFTHAIFDPNNAIRDMHILDYALLLSSLSDKKISQKFKIETKRIDMHQMGDREKVLSDHHGLLSKLSI